MKDVLIEVRAAERTFDAGRVHALRGVDLEVREGEFVAIIGPSGSGKSSLLQLLGALDHPDKGMVVFRGRPLSELGDLSLFRARHVGFVFQSFHLLPTMTAEENVQMPMFEMPWAADERRRRAVALLEAVGLADRRDHLPHKLSGGERQRVAVARSLANDPVLLLADEPTGNLDSVSARRIMELLRELHQSRGMTLVVVTHDPRVAAYADRVVEVLDGQIVSNTSNHDTSCASLSSF